MKYKLSKFVMAYPLSARLECLITYAVGELRITITVINNGRGGGGGGGGGGWEIPNISLFLETAFNSKTFIFKTPPNPISIILAPPKNCPFIFLLYYTSSQTIILHVLMYTIVNFCCMVSICCTQNTSSSPLAHIFGFEAAPIQAKQNWDRPPFLTQHPPPIMND